MYFTATLHLSSCDIFVFNKINENNIFEEVNCKIIFFFTRLIIHLWGMQKKHLRGYSYMQSKYAIKSEIIKLQKMNYSVAVPAPPSVFLLLTIRCVDSDRGTH